MRINQYEIIKLLGEGGMGSVFLARDLRLGRRVAIKFLQTDQPEETQRLLVEARTTARCQHDNIVVIYEAGEQDGVLYLVLEYLEGKPLKALIEHDRRLPYMRAVEIMCSIARALQCAHAAGIVHRDLKPENIFVTEAGTIKVFDFGIAKTDDSGGEHDPDDAIAGTLQYMSPEQWTAGSPIDHLTDIWACGIVLYQMICGRHPLPASQILTLRALDRPMPSMAEAVPPGVPHELIRVVDRCLHKRRDQRWQNAAELLAALAPFLPGRRAIELQADESPYAGLAAFQERDAGKFFGRNLEITEMVARLRDRPMMAVLGSSGIGKSSFVRAGVIPALKRSGDPWEALILRPGRKPLEALAAMLHPLVPTVANFANDIEEHRRLVETLHREPGHLGSMLRLRARREPRSLLLFVDQLEELYTLVADPAERAAFTACLSAVADDPTSPLRVVLSIRADFFDRITEDRRFAGELAKGLFFLGRPSREALRDAITSPAEMAAYHLELRATVDDMLDHLESTPGALPLLQFAAAKLWELRDRPRRLLTHASYTAMGGVAGALAGHADRVLIEIGPQRAPLVRQLLLRLVTAERTRAIVPLADLCELSRETGEVQRLIDQLVDARLLVVQTLEGGEGAAVEIVHESLVDSWPTLRRWLDEDHEDAAIVGQLQTAARQWAAKGRDTGLLWRGDSLDEYQRWRRRHTASLTQLEAEFGAASIAQATRSRRIRRALVVAAAAITAVFVVALWRANLAANLAKSDAENLLRNSYLEQGRLRVLEDDKLGAIAPLTTAYRMGATGPATRFLLEEAVRPTRARQLTLEGHTDKLWDVAFSPDGKWLATASADRTARIWDAATGAPHAVVRHGDRVTAIAFSPDSHLLASGGVDHTVRVWDVIDGREVAALPVVDGVHRVAFSPDGTMLLAALAHGTVTLWKIPSGVPAGELGGHEDIRGAVFCGDGSCIVTRDRTKLVVWDARTLAPRVTYRTSWIMTAAVSRTGSLLALGTLSGELVLLRGDGTEIARRAAHDELIYDIAISPDETLIATGSNDRTARLWSASGEPRGILAGHRANITGVRFTPAGDRIVTTSADNTARIWSASGMSLGELAGHTDIIINAALRSDGDRLATASWDFTAIVWDLASAQEIRPILAARDRALPAVAFAPGGDRLAVARDDGTLSLVDVQTGVPACTTATGGPIRALAWTTGAKIAVVHRGASAVELWDASRCAVAAPLEHPTPITAMSTRPGPRLVTAADGVVRVWNRGHLETDLAGFPGSIEKVGVDGDDIYAITNQMVVVVALGASAPRRTFHAVSIASVLFDRARGWLLGATRDQSLYVWDTATGALVRKLDGTGPLTSVRQSPDGALLIGVGGISPAIWDAATGARIGRLEGHTDLVTDGEFIADRLFVSLAGNHTALVWDVSIGHPLTRFLDVETMAVSDDRRSVALIGATGVRLWSPRMPAPDLDALRALHLK